MSFLPNCWEQSPEVGLVKMAFESKKEKNTKSTVLPVIKILLNIFAMLAVVAELVLCVYLLSSPAKLNDAEQTTRIDGNGGAQFEAAVSRIESGALDGIFNMPKIYVLPISDESAPEPNSGGYSTMADDGRGTYRKSEIGIYEDETIRAEVWKEYHDESVYNFAEVTIAHPSQLRHVFADDDFYSSNRYKPLTIAKSKNAVVAMTADFCKYRNYGVVIHNRKLYRNKARFLDILLVDSDGNFHTIKGKDNGKDILAETGIRDDYDIIFSLSFGPAVVKNGKARTKKDIGYYPLGEPWNVEPRAAIGQIGELHYLMCTVDGRSSESKGITIIELGEQMAAKGCETAYILDGGQTATLMFNDKVYNKVAYGGMREVSDIIYFATAVPNGEE